MKTSFRTLVMCRAHELFKTGLSWSDSLKKSWQLYRLYKKMLTKKVTFYFEKVDGSIRKAIGTLQVDYSPKGNRKPNIFSHSTKLLSEKLEQHKELNMPFQLIAPKRFRW